VITSITSVSTNTAAATNTNSSTASGFASLQIVTASCHGVLNTQFIAPSPKPSWFDDLNAKLESLDSADLASVMKSFDTNAGSVLGQ